MEYCCHICSGDVQSALSSLDRVQRCLHCLVRDELTSNLQPLSHRRNVASLLLFPWQMFRRVTLASPIQTFTGRARHVTYTGSKHPPHVRIPLVRRKFHSDSSLPRNDTLQNRLSTGYSPDRYNRSRFKSRINRVT